MKSSPGIIKTKPHKDVRGVAIHLQLLLRSADPGGRTGCGSAARSVAGITGFESR